MTTTNDLKCARAVLVTDLKRVKRGKRQTRKEPWWKRQLENQVKILNIVKMWNSRKLSRKSTRMPFREDIRFKKRFELVKEQIM